jgi:effector-binding domain-containing protein
MPAPEVHLTTASPRLVAAVRSRTTLPDLPKAIRAGLDQVWPQIKDRSGRNIVLYHPSEPTGLGREFEIETGVEVPDGFTPEAPVYLTRTPGGRVVTATHVGPYDRMKTTYDAIDAYVRQNGVKITGPSWEVYGHWNDDPAQLHTDIFFTVGERAPPNRP